MRTTPDQLPLCQAVQTTKQKRLAAVLLWLAQKISLLFRTWLGKHLTTQQVTHRAAGSSLMLWCDVVQAKVEQCFTLAPPRVHIRPPCNCQRCTRPSCLRAIPLRTVQTLPL